MKESVRLYLRELRDKQSITQQDAADNIGWSLRAFSDWETGKTEDIKFRFLIRLVSMLNASWEDITRLELENIKPEERTSITEKRLQTTSGEISSELQSLIEQLKTDEALVRAFLIFWSGWKAKETV